MRSKTRTLAGFITVAFVLCAGEFASAQGKGGGGNAGTAAGALYGDLYVIERDGAGVPITRGVTYLDTTAEPPAQVTVQCVQPLAATCSKLRLWGEMGILFDPEVNDPCAVYTDDVGLIQEVKFGRESVSRAPATVLDKSYAEALKMINSAARPPSATTAPSSSTRRAGSRCAWPARRTLARTPGRRSTRPSRTLAFTARS